MDDKTEILLLTTLGIGPGSAILVAHLCGWHSFWLSMLALILGAASSLIAVAAFLHDRQFDDGGHLKTKHRKLIVNGLRCLMVVAILTAGWIPT